MAEAAMRRLADDAGLADQLVVDSAGTGGWHAGDPADERAAAAAAARGYEVSGVARQVTRLDFADFDLLVAMDHYNLRYLRDLAPDREARLKARLLLRDGDVPDPYNGPAAAFERALDLIVAGCRELLAEMTTAPG
jgi:protein-tyrosine phosphatase